MDKLTEEQQKQYARLEEFAKEFEERSELAQKISEERGLPFTTALIIAGDELSRERAEALVAEGKSILFASIGIGSYARFDWLVEQYYGGNLSPDEFFPVICQYWRAADPDDTNPFFLDVWEDAYSWNDFKTLTDEDKSLPDESWLTAYRGQMSDTDIMGVSWSLSKDIAEKFARGAALRINVLGGSLITARVPRAAVIAYISGRNEEEIIVNPVDVEIVQVEEIGKPGDLDS